MNKSRIGELAEKAIVKDGYDFDKSFEELKKTLRDMNLETQKLENINTQATQVCDGLCSVAESLVVN